jgi:hypothetical protein
MTIGTTPDVRGPLSKERPPLTRASIVNHPAGLPIRVGFVRADSIVVDRSYQRDEQQRRINDMAGRWDDQKAGAVIVSDRGDRRVILDGQQRVMAARIAGVVWLPAVFLDVEDVPTEADLFVRINKDRRSLTPMQLFKGELRAGYVEALEIDETVRRHGFHVAKDAANGIGSISALKTIHALGSLDGTLTTIIEAWPVQGTRDRFTREILIAVGSFLRHYRKADRERLARMMGQLTPEQVTTALLASTGKSRSASIAGPTAQVNVVVDIYNKNLRSGRLKPLEPMARVPSDEAVS